MSEGREAAPRFEGRTITVELPAPFEGWEATMRRDFPARYLEDMRAASDVADVCRVLDQWVMVEHNFPDMDGNVATSMLDVYPVDAVIAAVTEFRKATGTLPNP